MKLISLIFFFSLLNSVFTQEVIETKRFFYSDENIMPNDKDSLPYIFKRKGDTIIARTALIHMAVEKRNLKKLKKSKTWGTYLFEGRQIYDGRFMVHRLNDYFFVVLNDTLCKITTKYSVPNDSIKTIYKMDLKFQEIQNLINNVSYQTLDTLFSCHFFDNNNYTKSISNNSNCMDIITLRKYWKVGNEKFYQFSIKYNCNLSETEEWYIIDSNFEFHGFNTKYYSSIGKNLKSIESDLNQILCK